MKYPIKEPVRVLSLGAGVQSSALLFAYLNGLLKPAPHFAVFADTQSEPKHVYDWLEKLKAAAKGKIKIIIATHGNLVEDHTAGKRFASIPFFIKTKRTVPIHGDEEDEDGFLEIVGYEEIEAQGMGRRQCTSEYKLKPIKKAIRTEIGYVPKQRVKHTVHSLIGISTDEAQRMKDSTDAWNINRYPLIEDLEWDRTQCYGYVQEQGLGDPPKSACFVCPYRSNDSWKSLKQRDPEAFEKAAQFEERVQDIDRRKVRRVGFHGTPFLHRSMVPLREIDWESLQPNPPLFGDECEGMCGV